MFHNIIPVENINAVVRNIIIDEEYIEENIDILQGTVFDALNNIAAFYFNFISGEIFTY